MGSWGGIQGEKVGQGVLCDGEGGGGAGPAGDHDEAHLGFGRIDEEGAIRRRCVGSGPPFQNRWRGDAGGAMELVKDRETKEPDPQSVLRVFEESRKRRVLVGKGGLYGNVIRTGMMLNSTQDHVDELITALDASFAAAA